MTTKTLFKGTERELLITDNKGIINVYTKEDLRLRELKRQQLKFIIETGSIIILAFLLGICLTYLMMK